MLLLPETCIFMPLLARGRSLQGKTIADFHHYLPVLQALHLTLTDRINLDGELVFQLIKLKRWASSPLLARVLLLRLGSSPVCMLIDPVCMLSGPRRQQTFSSSGQIVPLILHLFSQPKGMRLFLWNKVFYSVGDPNSHLKQSASLLVQ